MANDEIPPTTLEAMWSAVVAGNPVKARAVSSAYTFSSAHDFFDDVTDRLGNSVALSGVTYTSGRFTASPFTLTGLSTTAIRGIWVYADTGVESTSRLLVYITLKADSTSINLSPAGLTVNVDFPSNLIATI